MSYERSVGDISVVPRMVTAGQQFSVSLRVTSNSVVSQVMVYENRTSGYLHLEEGGNPRSGMWNGTIPVPMDMEGYSDVYVAVWFEGQNLQAPVSGQNIGGIFVTAAPPSSTEDNTEGTVIGAQETHSSMESTTTDNSRVTTLTFHGPVTVQNMTSESGKCVVRISVPGRVVINCECPQTK